MSITGWVTIGKRPLKHFMKEGNLICGTWFLGGVSEKSQSKNAITLFTNRKTRPRCLKCHRAKEKERWAREQAKVLSGNE